MATVTVHVTVVLFFITVYVEIFAGISFCKIMKMLALRISCGFIFCKYVARLMLRPNFRGFCFRECGLTCEIRKN